MKNVHILFISVNIYIIRNKYLQNSWPRQLCLDNYCYVVNTLSIYHLYWYKIHYSISIYSHKILKTMQYIMLCSLELFAIHIPS